MVAEMAVRTLQVKTDLCIPAVAAVAVVMRVFISQAATAVPAS